VTQEISSGRAPVARSFGARLGRLVRLRLMIPILRSRHPPEYTARGVFVGLLVALTPTVGAQMLIVAAIWVVAKAMGERWDFNVIVACAWTWTTNVVTVPPVYYVFLVTGRLMLGDFNALPRFDIFHSQLLAVLEAHESWLSSLWHIVWRILDLWGLPMMLGSVPWAIAGAVLGYYWSLRLVRRFRRRRASP
jgi:uncharacterized protein (DUF2062 family)